MDIGKVIRITTVPDPMPMPVILPAPVRERELVPVRKITK